MEIKAKRLREKAVLPKRATLGSAGSDLYACLEAPVLIEPGKTQKIPTGIAIALPGPECAAFLYARSGLGVKNGIVPANCVGVVDADYRGEIIIALYNHSAEAFTVQPGDRIAQMVIAPVLLTEFVECEELDETERGTGGFGSTGLGDNAFE